jgi:hypothetical protein
MSISLWSRLGKVDPYLLLVTRVIFYLLIALGPSLATTCVFVHRCHRLERRTEIDWIGWRITGNSCSWGRLPGITSMR